VVEDSEPIRSLLSRALRAHGFSVHVATTGPDALRLALEILPDVAIVDQWMPGMTGADLIRLLGASPREEVRAIPVVGLSGKAGSEVELLGAGARHFLPKPFGESELLAALRVALGEKAS